MAPTTRSTAPKKGKGKSGKHSSTPSIGKDAVTKSTKPSKKTSPKRKDPDEESLSSIDEVRASPPESAASLFDSGFRPSVDNRYEPSTAEIAFGRRNTLFSASPGNESPAAAGFRYRSPRKSIFQRTPLMSATSPTARADHAFSHRDMPPPLSGISPKRFTSIAEDFQGSTPRRSEFGRMASVSAFSPARPASSGGFPPSSPRQSIFGDMVPSMSSSPRTPWTPQSAFVPKETQPAKITVSASTKQEAESVLARQQLVRESLFELREIITNLNWKVQQFESLVDKAEKDVVWDTASISITEREGEKSEKRLRFLFDPVED